MTRFSRSKRQYSTHFTVAKLPNINSVDKTKHSFLLSIDAAQQFLYTLTAFSKKRDLNKVTVDLSIQCISTVNRSLMANAIQPSYLTCGHIVFSRLLTSQERVAILVLRLVRLHQDLLADLTIKRLDLTGNRLRSYFCSFTTETDRHSNKPKPSE